MAGPVQLRRSFDPLLSAAGVKLNQFGSRMTIERARPTVWSKEQLEDLKLLFDGIGHLANALSELAGRVRDD